MIAVKESQPSNVLSIAAAILGGVVAIALFMFVLMQIGLIQIGGGTAVTAQLTTVTTQQMAFSQPEIRVQAGQPVQFQMRNADMFEHSFDIDGLNVHVPVGSRDSALVEFTPIEPGTYHFYCGVPGHAEAGMVGTLIVE